MPSIGDLVVNLKANTADFTGKMKSAASGLKDFQAEAMVAAAAIGGAMAYSAKTFADYDDAIRSVGAVTQTSGTAAFEMLNQKAKELGRTTSFTAIEVANLMTELGRAGFDASQIDNMTAAVLNLSRATGTDAAMSAGIMSATIRQFGLEASDAGRVADVLTMTASKTFNTVEQLGEAFSYVGPVMKQLKIPLEDAAAALGMLGNVGIQGSNAGTAFKRFALLTNAEAEKMEQIFGVSFKGVNGSIMSLTDTLATLQGAIATMDDATAVKSLNDAFGLLGITGAASLAAAGDGVKNLRDELLQAEGASKRMAVEMDSGLGGAFRKMLSAAEGLAIEVGRRLAPMFNVLADALAAGAAFATKYAGVLVPLATGLLAVATATISVVAALKAYAIAKRIALALSGPKGWAILAIGIGAAATAAYAMAGAEKELGNAIANTNSKTKSATSAVRDIGNASRAASAGVASLSGQTDGLKEMLERLQTPAERISKIVRKLKDELIASGSIVWDGHPLVMAMIEHEAGFTEAMQSIKDELSILRGEATETGLALDRMLAAGVDPAQVEQLRALYAEREKLNAQVEQQRQQEDNKKYWEEIAADQQAQADAIYQSLKTPEELYRDEQRRVQALVDAGKLSQEAANQFLAMSFKPDETLSENMNEPIQRSGVMERGSEAAFKTILQAADRSPVLAESKKQTKLLKQIADKKPPKMKTIPFSIQGAV